MKIGSLFSGYGGLDCAVEAVFGATTAWHAEVDAAPSRILAARWPGVPNLGDVTTVDWSTVEPVDIIAGGSPCQDVSHAGKRAGMRAGTRSGLWASMCDAIEVIRPRFVVWENVRGVLSAEADSALEPCPGCVGDGDDGPVLRALGRVLGDLAELGFDARWYGLRAADVGAPHGRFRIFVVAADATSESWGVGDGDVVRAGWGTVGRRPAAGTGTAADAAHVGHERRRTPRRGGNGPADSRLTSADADRDGREGVGRLDTIGRDADRCGRQDRPREAVKREACATPDAEDRVEQGQPTRDDRDTALVGTSARAGSGDRAGNPSAGISDVGRGARIDWGKYAPAIERWQAVLGRVAPAPTERAPKGGQRLSPRFVEWMMGLPAGWVTDVPGITRNEQLRALGNGVVPQQAEAALRAMLNVGEVAA